MKKVWIVFLSLWALLTVSSFAFDINDIFNVYRHKSIKLCFTQLSINGMTGQSIERKAIMTIVANRRMEFEYPDEKIVINNFQAVDVKNGKRRVYKLSGFNRVLFDMFLGRKNIKELFDERRVDNSTYQLLPKYESNIASVYVYISNDRVKKIKIVDIYANRTVYTFYDFPCKRAQRGS